MWPTHSLLCFYDTMNRIYNIMYMNSEVQYIKEYLCKDTEELFFWFIDSFVLNVRH